MENHIDPSTMLEFIEGLAAMAVLDQDGVYTYVSPGWERYTGLDGAVISMKSFGASAPAAKLFEKFGFTADHVVEVVENLMK